MARYVDGFVIPIKKSKLKEYKKLATLGRKVWLEYGALDYYECVGDDYKIYGGIPFPKLCKLKPGETVVFAFVVYKSRAHRNRVNKKVHTDERLCGHQGPMPFDMKRFTCGGFKTLVHK